MYFAGNRKVSEEYRKRLSHTKLTGTINGRHIEGYEQSPGFFNWTSFGQSGRKTKTFGLFSVEAAALNELVKAKGNVEKAIKNLSKATYGSESIEFLKKNKINLFLTKKPGTLYKVDIPGKDVMLDEDKRGLRSQKKAFKTL